MEFEYSISHDLDSKSDRDVPLNNTYNYQHCNFSLPQAWLPWDQGKDY